LKELSKLETVIGIENGSRNNIEYTLDGVFDFINFRHKDMAPKYKVFKELFIICWAGIPKECVVKSICHVLTLNSSMNK
jgi:hypothetical protein